MFQDIHKAQNMEDVALSKQTFKCWCDLFIFFTSDGYEYLCHSGYPDNPKDKCTALSRHRSLLHFYRRMHEDSLARKIQGGTLRNESVKWGKFIKKNIHPFKILCICSYLPWEPTKVVFTITANNPICS